MGKRRLGILVVTAVMTLAATQAHAGQKSGKPETAEDVIVVHSGSGEELHGRLLELSPATLAILVDGRRVEVPMDDVLRIDTRHDSVKNGAIIGGAIAGGLVALTCSGFEGPASACVAAAIVDGGFGALIGAGIDALHKGRTPIYIKAGKSASAVQVKFRF
jgi:hypothetical protein